MRARFAFLLSGLVICTGCSGGKLLPKQPDPVFDDAAVGSPSPNRKLVYPPAPAPVPKDQSKSQSPKPSELIVTPENVVAGKVVRYNDTGRFVVLDFPLGRTPPVEQRMFVYRRGLKVGEIKITGPQIENHIVADLTAGEAQQGDEIRNK